MPADVIPIPSEAQRWREREQDRFNSGTYTDVPWRAAEWWAPSLPFANHYAHVSTADPSKLAYTPSEQHGLQDRQVRMKAGKYLKKYFGDVLTAQQIQEFAGAFAAANEAHTLQLATTPDEIEHVYTNGPNSCMAHEADSFNGPCHPTRAYGAGDLAVAYVQREDTISARAVCWPAKKLWCGVVYGDRDRLVPALETAGYAIGSFEGARLLLIDADEHGYVAPWLDGTPTSVDVDSGHLVIRARGEHSCRETGGTLCGGPTCDSCRESCGEESCSVGDETWCQGCYENGAFYCEGCEECYPDTEYHSIDDSAWCSSCAQTDAYQCGRCHEWHSKHGNSTPTDVDGDTWCDSCTCDYATYCESCGEHSAADSHIILEGSGEARCEECASDSAYQCEECGEWHESSGRPTANAFADTARCAFCHAVWIDDSATDGTAPDAALEYTPSALLPAVCATTAPAILQAVCAYGRARPLLPAVCATTPARRLAA